MFWTRFGSLRSSLWVSSWPSSTPNACGSQALIPLSNGLSRGSFFCRYSVQDTYPSWTCFSKVFTKSSSWRLPCTSPCAAFPINISCLGRRLSITFGFMSFLVLFKALETAFGFMQRHKFNQKVLLIIIKLMQHWLLHLKCLYIFVQNWKGTCVEVQDQQGVFLVDKYPVNDEILPLPPISGQFLLL